MVATDVLRTTNDALWLVLILSAPPIIVASIVGVFVALIQAATQIQEQTIQYTLKFFAIIVTIAVTASLLGGTLYKFTNQIFTDFPGMVN
jgi:type III secretion protein S